MNFILSQNISFSLYFVLTLFYVFYFLYIMRIYPCLSSTYSRTILAIGGQSESSLLDTVEVYDCGHNNWTLRAPLPQALRCTTAVSFKGSLYVFGGENSTEVSRAAYRSGIYEISLVIKVLRLLKGNVIFINNVIVIKARKR